MVVVGDGAGVGEGVGVGMGKGVGVGVGVGVRDLLAQACGSSSAKIDHRMASQVVPPLALALALAPVRGWHWSVAGTGNAQQQRSVAGTGPWLEQMVHDLGGYSV